MTDGTTTPGLDMSRLPYEIMRALDGNFVLAQGLDPGLFIEPALDTRECIVIQHGQELARFPRYRLERPDPELLRKAAAEAATRLPLHIADQCVAAINAGDFVLNEPPDQEFVSVDVRIGPGDAIKLFKAHRRVVVTNWP